MWESGPPFDTWFLGPTRLHILNGISIGLAGFASCRARDRDRRTDNAILRLVLRCGLIIGLCGLSSGANVKVIHMFQAFSNANFHPAMQQLNTAADARCVCDS